MQAECLTVRAIVKLPQDGNDDDDGLFKLVRAAPVVGLRHYVVRLLDDSPSL